MVFVACGDADVAEDAAAEAFTRALDHWDRVQGMASPDAWACRVAVYVMRRRVRRRTIERRLLGRRVVSPLGIEGDALPEVWVAVRDLPQRQRLAILLRYVADLTEAEAAAVMGVSRGRSRLR